MRPIPLHQILSADTLFLSGGSAQGTGISGIRFLTAYAGASGATTNTPAETMRIQNGNVGIGTSTLNNANGLSILGGESLGSYATTAAPPGGMIISGNVGIGSIAPGQALDVNGTARMTGFQLGNSTTSGYVLTANASGAGTWQASAGSSSGWTVSGSNVYETAGGNVGIGTTLLTTAALTVMNGNVGIGTWVPGAALQVVGNGTNSIIASNGNITSPAGNDLTVVAPSGHFLYLEGAGNSSSITMGNGLTFSTGPTINSGNLTLPFASQGIGIGMTFVGGTGEAMLSVMNGNVGSARGCQEWLLT